MDSGSTAQPMPPPVAIPQPRPLSVALLLWAVLYALLTAVLMETSLLLAWLPTVFVLFLIPLLRSARSGPILLLFLIPLLSGMPRGAIVPFLRANEIVLAIVFGTYLAVLLLGKKHRPETSFLEKGFLLLLAARSILPLVAHPLDFAADPTKLVKFFLAPLQYYFIYRLVLGAVKSRGHILILMRVMMAAGVIVAVVGLLQMVRFPGLAQLYGFYYPSAEAVYTFLHSVRVTSLFHSLSGGTVRQFHGGGWNVAGFYLAQSIAIGIALYRLESPGLARRILAIALALFALVLVLTFSFTSILSLLAIAIYVGYRQRRLRRYLAQAVLPVLIFGVIASIFFADEFAQRMSLQFRGSWIPHTMMARFDFWIYEALPAVARHLVLGFGPSRYDWIASESVYLYLIANCGIVGLAGFIWFLVMIWKRFSALSRRHAANSLAGIMSLLSLGLLLQIALASTTGLYFEFSGASEQMWAIWAMTIAADRMTNGPDRSARGV